MFKLFLTTLKFLFIRDPVFKGVVQCTIVCRESSSLLKCVLVQIYKWYQWFAHKNMVVGWGPNVNSIVAIGLQLSNTAIDLSVELLTLYILINNYIIIKINA